MGIKILRLSKTNTLNILDENQVRWKGNWKKNTKRITTISIAGKRKFQEQLTWQFWQCSRQCSMGIFPPAFLTRFRNAIFSKGCRGLTVVKTKTLEWEEFYLVRDRMKRKSTNNREDEHWCLGRVGEFRFGKRRCRRKQARQRAGFLAPTQIAKERD